MSMAWEKSDWLVRKMQSIYTLGSNLCLTCPCDPACLEKRCGIRTKLEPLLVFMAWALLARPGLPPVERLAVRIEAAGDMCG